VEAHAVRTYAAQRGMTASTIGRLPMPVRRRSDYPR
jgi:hypothetical protein